MSLIITLFCKFTILFYFLKYLSLLNFGHSDFCCLLSYFYTSNVMYSWHLLNRNFMGVGCWRFRLNDPASGFVHCIHVKLLNFQGGGVSPPPPPLHSFQRGGGGCKLQICYIYFHNLRRSITLSPCLSFIETVEAPGC